MKPLRYFLILLICLSTKTWAQKVIQADIKSLLNARLVTTLTDNKIVLWKDALDGGTSGMATRAAVLTTGDSTSIALPDDGTFKATKDHPYVVLNYSNADGKNNQARRSIGADLFTISTPKKSYEKVFLFVMSGYGKSTLNIKMIYSDKTSEKCQRVVPDWFHELTPADTNFCYLATNFGKWDNQNKLMEADHHYLVGAILQPNPAKKLVNVVVEKEQKGVLTLWGVTLQKAGFKKK